MRKKVFIAVLVLFSCTAKKQQHTVAYAEVEEEKVPAKNYVYIDTPTEEAPVMADRVEIYDSTSTVEAPVEEQYSEEGGDTLLIDTTVYRWQLAVSADSVNEWKKMKQFAYMKNIDSLLKADLERKKQEANKEKKKTSGGGWLDALLSSKGLQVLLWVLAALFVLFVIFQLFITNGPFKRKSRSLSADAPVAEEEVITPESDFDRMIRQAVEQKNYRLAIRYHYLQSLHALAKKNYVQLAVDKTNYSYVREITDYNKQNDFAGLTLNYEYVWYGEFEIDELIYLKLKPAFLSFNSKI